MDHPNQNTMLLPASYAVISEEEMTYLDGGQSIYLGSAFNHDIYFNTDQFGYILPECSDQPVRVDEQLFLPVHRRPCAVRSVEWSEPVRHLLSHLG